jgi:hypothetical protein
MTVKRLVAVLVAAFGIAQSVNAQGVRQIQFEAVIGAFIPARSMGQLSGFEGQVRAGTDLRLALETDRFINTARFRFSMDVVPATSTRLRPTADCVVQRQAISQLAQSDCRESTLTTWIIAPRVDLIWPVPSGDHLSLLGGGGLAFYGHALGDCVDLVGALCLRRFPYTEDVVRPTFHVGAQLRAGRGSRAALEATDSATPIDQGIVQSDVRIGLVVRF